MNPRSTNVKSLPSENHTNVDLVAWDSGLVTGSIKFNSCYKNSWGIGGRSGGRLRRLRWFWGLLHDRPWPGLSFQ